MSDNIVFEYDRFKNLTYSDFKRLATNNSLSCYEKIGFPSVYRQGKEEAIFTDILRKLSNLNDANKMILDIGAGCSQLPLILSDFCRNKNHKLYFIDSCEMLTHLPSDSFITKLEGPFPEMCKDFILSFHQKFDVIISYSVLQYVFTEANIFDFIDVALGLLMPGGQFLIGDIPNASKRRRFLSTERGVQYHKEYYNPSTVPEVNHMQLDLKQIDDGVLLGLLMRYRNAGYDTYLIPQDAALPMSNRREDLLIIKP
ncbi:hypothetical protein AQUSIP_17900 [Aquicella siphonis]|uniref:Uncharacterized protein n=1 Tax=Aquicella siphonis TaxID=254247 RepID=A0A5E4PJ66_9COXI|nr:class I SAM-dependent methyltransferase [Aquicella siphonis]VVC76477.1 hypothetical protein AQUSIP_17900 [Aquicella siphonis]